MVNVRNMFFKGTDEPAQCQGINGQKSKTMLDAFGTRTIRSSGPHCIEELFVLDCSLPKRLHHVCQALCLPTENVKHFMPVVRSRPGRLKYIKVDVTMTTHLLPGIQTAAQGQQCQHDGTRASSKQLNSWAAVSPNMPFPGFFLITRLWNVKLF